MSKQADLYQLIVEKVYVQGKDEPIASKEREQAWIFDFRRLLMNGKASDLISDIFFEAFKDQYPFQLCTLEIAGVPLVTSLMNKFYQRGYTDINAVFIRKSRKKSGLMRMVEGELQPGKKIILVDDILNSGDSFWRQVEVLESLGYGVDTIWSILGFRSLSYYNRFYNRGIKVKRLFDLNDFTHVLGPNITNRVRRKKPVSMPFRMQWAFKSPNPSLDQVVNKSQPILDETKVYFGSDNETFWALNQSDGSVSWQYKVGKHVRRKSIYSNPALFKNSVMFGSYDGNIYCLDKRTGKELWINREADWVGSSPAVAHDLEMVFVGLEFGVMFKRGGIIALDANTGKPIWIDRNHIGMTHSSPKYLQDHQEVVIGSNDGIVRLYDARTGVIKWTFTTFGGAHPSNVQRSGFGIGDIKESFAYSPKHDYLIFGSSDSFLYVLDRQTGHLVKQFKSETSVIATPYLYENCVYYTSTDKHLRCIDLDNLKLVFETNVDSTRLFSSPTVINGKLYVGTNAARLHELDLKTGAQLSYFQTVERITNTVVYNPKTDIYFLPTYANEIIALKRIPNPT